MNVVRKEAWRRSLWRVFGKTYSGPLALGEDLMVIDIGETVTVRRPAPVSR